ncbi:MAG TPA: extracellular solute-binding protein, partial [Chloroflexota bacterium]|nr:extracellular solute-binding protein [Chloroflexota bacterium]
MNRVSRRTIVTAALAGAPPALLAACGGGTSQAPQADLSKKETKLTFMFWAPRVETFQNSAKGFNQKFPKIQVELLQQPTDFHPKLQAMVAAGTPPETWALELQKTQFYAKMGAAQPLSSYYKRDKEVRREDLPELKQKQISDTKGEIYGTSPNMSGNFIHYNIDLFKQAGLSDPYDLWKQDKWTWDAFATAARQHTKRDGSGKATQVASTPGVVRLWMNNNGAEEFDNFVAPTKCLYDAPAAIESLSWQADQRLKQQVFLLSAQNE